jgi:hypothetical protein
MARAYWIDVSIVRKKDFVNCTNYEQLIKYLQGKNISYEEVYEGDLRKGKCTFYYSNNVYYFDYYIHYCYFRLTCPQGFEPGDIDLPERVYFQKKMVYDSETDKFFQAKSGREDCDFELTHLNGYGNELMDPELIGKCYLAHDDDVITSTESLGPGMKDLIKDILC